MMQIYWFKNDNGSGGIATDIAVDGAMQEN